MDQLFSFIGNHPFLVGTFILLLALFIRNETQRGGQSVSAQQLVDLVNRSDAVVLDVRDKKEFEAGHIVGLRFIDQRSRDRFVGRYQR